MDEQPLTRAEVIAFLEQRGWSDHGPESAPHCAVRTVMRRNKDELLVYPDGFRDSHYRHADTLRDACELDKIGGNQLLILYVRSELRGRS